MKDRIKKIRDMVFAIKFDSTPSPFTKNWDGSNKLPKAVNAEPKKPEVNAKPKSVAASKPDWQKSTEEKLKDLNIPTKQDGSIDIDALNETFKKMQEQFDALSQYHKVLKNTSDLKNQYGDIVDALHRMRNTFSGTEMVKAAAFAKQTAGNSSPVDLKGFGKSKKQNMLAKYGDK